MIYILDFHSLFPKVRHLATGSRIFISPAKRHTEMDKCVKFTKVVKVNVLGKHSGLHYNGKGWVQLYMET